MPSKVCGTYRRRRLLQTGSQYVSDTILPMSMSQRLLPLLLAASLFGQTDIRVDATSTQGPPPPIFAWFGYDEPNYTYTANGKKLLGELAAMSPVRVSVRTHH